MIAALILMCFSSYSVSAQDCAEGRSCQGVPWKPLSLPPPLVSPTPFPTIQITATPTLTPTFTITPSITPTFTPTGTLVSPTPTTTATSVIDTEDFRNQIATFEAIMAGATAEVDSYGAPTDEELAGNAGFLFAMIGVMRNFQFGRMTPLITYFFGLVTFTLVVQGIVFLMPILVAVWSLIRKVIEFVNALLKP